MVKRGELDRIYGKCYTLGMGRVMLPGFRCERCEHEWVPRDKTEEPRVCPKCKSPYWDRPRRTDPPVRESETQHRLADKRPRGVGGRGKK